MKSSPCAAPDIDTAFAGPSGSWLQNMREVLQRDAREHHEAVMIAIGRTRAKTIPLHEMPTSASTEPSGKTSDVVAIASDLSSPLRGHPVGSPVQAPRRIWKPKTKRARDMLRLIESLPEPWTTTRVARAYDLTEQNARYWLNLFAARLGWDVIPGVGGGFRWTP